MKVIIQRNTDIIQQENCNQKAELFANYFMIILRSREGNLL